MSLARRSFLRALIGAPFAAKAVERMIANGAPKMVQPVEEKAWEKSVPLSGGLSHLDMSGCYVQVMRLPPAPMVPYQSVKVENRGDEWVVIST